MIIVRQAEQKTSRRWLILGIVILFILLGVWGLVALLTIHVPVRQKLTGAPQS